MSAFKLSENDRRRILLSSESIEDACSYDCIGARNSYPCPNDMRCKDLFSRSKGAIVVKFLRLEIWGQRDSSGKFVGLASRRENFVSTLEKMHRTESGAIVFCLEGHIVCKSFFKVRPEVDAKFPHAPFLIHMPSYL